MVAEDPTKGRDPFARYRDRLAAVGFRPSSARGQNFLLDQSLHRWIAEQAAPTADDTAVEIGVGLGFLTRELAARAGRVLAVEIEPRLLEIARADLDAQNVEFHCADALDGPGRTLTARVVEVAAACRGRLLVVANLPYSVSGPVLAELAQLERPADRIVVLVQKELGQRLAAGAGEPAYGGLSALLQALYDVRLLRDVSPAVFRPRPKVASAVVALELRPEPGAGLGAADGRRRFARFVRVLFEQRRKVLRTTCRRAAAAVDGEAPADVLDELGDRRAEQLAPDEVAALWRRCDPAC